MYVLMIIESFYFFYSRTVFVLPQEYEKEQEHNLTSTTTTNDTQQVGTYK